MAAAKRPSRFTHLGPKAEEETTEEETTTDGGDAPAEEEEGTEPASEGEDAPADEEEEDETVAAAVAAASPALQAQLAAARQAGYDEALAYVGEVMELCAIAKVSSKAVDFIAKKVPTAGVRKALLTARANEADAAGIVAAAPVANGDAIEQINKIAAELRKADTKLSKAQAFAKACDLNPQLYAAQKAEARAARRGR